VETIPAMFIRTRTLSRRSGFFTGCSLHGNRNFRKINDERVVA
jgi:hypothetical protein